MSRKSKAPKTIEDVRNLLLSELDAKATEMPSAEWNAISHQITNLTDDELAKIAEKQGYKVKAPKAPKVPKAPKQAPAAAPAVEHPIDMLAAQQMLGAAGGGMPMLPEPPTGWGSPVPEWERQAIPLAESMAGSGGSPIDMLSGTQEMAGVPLASGRPSVEPLAVGPLGTYGKPIGPQPPEGFLDMGPQPPEGYFEMGPRPQASQAYEKPIGPRTRIGKDPVKRAAAEKRLAARSKGSPLMKGLGAVGTAAGLAMGPLMLYQMLKGGDEPYQMPQDEISAMQAASQWRQMDRIQRALDDIGSGTGLPSEIDELIAGHEQELQAARVPMPGPTLRQRYMAAGVL